jgi:hypothetical protein
MGEHWPPWAKLAGPKQLAMYVQPEVTKLIRLRSSRYDAVVGEGDRRSVIADVYDALANCGIRYVHESFDPRASVQPIRQPVEIMVAPGEGTCLDLAVLFCGACLGFDLLPLLVWLDGHAFALVSLTNNRGGANALTRREREVFRNGELTDGNQLRAFVESGEYIAVECTGFAFSDRLPSALPEGEGRVHGRLPFERAILAGSAQLSSSDRPVHCALDIAMLQDVLSLPRYPLPPGYWVTASAIAQFALPRTPTDSILAAFGERTLNLDRLRTLYVQSAPDSARADPERVDGLPVALARLSDMRPRYPGALEPVVEFVARAAEELNSIALHQYADTWANKVENGDDELRRLRQRIHGERTAPNKCFHVLADVSGPMRRRGEVAVVRYWVYGPDGAELPGGDDSLEHAIECVIPTDGSDRTAQERVQHALTTVLERGMHRVWRACGSPTQVVLELLVSDAQMSWPFDEWKLDESSDDFTTPVGIRHPVIVRWADRAAGVAQLGRSAGPLARLAETWLKVAQRIRANARLCDTPETHWLALTGRSLGAIVAEIAETDYGACVGLLCTPGFDDPPSPDTVLARATLRGGAPYALWSRRPRENWQTLRSALDITVRDGALDALPARCVRLRTAAVVGDDPQAPGHALTLLWDDPARNPLGLRLEQPPQRSNSLLPNEHF